MANKGLLLSPFLPKYSRKELCLRRVCNPVKHIKSITTSVTARRTLTLDNMNQHVKNMEYAVRGPLVIRAAEIEKELKKGAKKPFDHVIRANIGDCHALGQVPITFIRQVLVLCLLPELLNDSRFPEDAKERVRAILSDCSGGSVGSYSDPAGVEIIRRHIAQYIERRDGGVASNWQNILLSSGASEAIKNVLRLLNNDINGKKPGVMVPVPLYPLYSATIAEFGMHPIGYFLHESKGWSLDIPELQKAIDEAKTVSYPRGIVVINPGNPTGQVLNKENIRDIIKFAHKENLFLFADEVYQQNIYSQGSAFHSFKKVLVEMGKPYSEMELASFMSCSKGYMGECGLRGGYVEAINMDPGVKTMYLKSINAMLCSTVIGQACMAVVVNPPQEGEPSHEQFLREQMQVLDALKLRAKMAEETFNSFENFSCNPVQGAMYAFPQVILPPKAIEAAEKKGQHPDAFYCFELLQSTGICVVPGSGFGQKAGTYHFRMTILPQTDHFKIMMGKFKEFHKAFLKKYK